MDAGSKHGRNYRNRRAIAGPCKTVVDWPIPQNSNILQFMQHHTIKTDEASQDLLGSYYRSGTLIFAGDSVANKISILPLFVKFIE